MFALHTIFIDRPVACITFWITKTHSMPKPLVHSSSAGPVGSRALLARSSICWHRRRRLGKLSIDLEPQKGAVMALAGSSRRRTGHVQIIKLSAIWEAFHSVTRMRRSSCRRCHGLPADGSGQMGHSNPTMWTARLWCGRMHCSCLCVTCKPVYVYAARSNSLPPLPHHFAGPTYTLLA